MAGGTDGDETAADGRDTPDTDVPGGADAAWSAAEPWGAPSGAERALAEALDRAAGLAASVGPAFAPADEALALRRLLTLPRAHLSAAGLTRLRRELEGERLARGAGLHVAVWGGSAPARAVLHVRARFGAAPPMAAAPSAEAALATARRPGGVAALAAEGPWPWWGRLLAEPDLRVFARLPDEGAPGAGSMLAVARVEVGPTGRDETWWATDAAGSAAAVERALGEAGLAGEVVAEAGGLKLVALAGYLQRQDARLARAPGRLTGVLGSAPLPLEP